MTARKTALKTTTLWFSVAALASLAGCGAGGDVNETSGTPIPPVTSPTPPAPTAPAPAPAPTPAPAPGTAATYYFSDCATGAAAGCIPGSNSNPGTLAAPKQNLAGVNVNALPAGTRLLFNRGGAWSNFSVALENLNTTAAAPLTFDAYGTGVAPLLRVAANNMFNVGGGWNNTSNDGGYVIRNLKLDGMGTAEWGFWFIQTVRDVTIENTEITGFRIGINSNDTDQHTVTGITLRNNNVHHNRAMGLLGHYSNFLIEGNLFEANNFGGSIFDHGTYIGGGHNITLRNNRYVRNSTVNGTCTGGNMTFHGQIDGLLIEGNTIEQDASAPSCYLMSITQGYSTPEWFRNATVRNNKLINGGSAIVVQSAPGIVVEDNVSINTTGGLLNSFMIGAGGVVINGDEADGNAIVRNNTVCRVLSSSSGYVTNILSPGATVSNNVMITGTAATTGVCAR
jgi:hypothetical protein